MTTAGPLVLDTNVIVHLLRGKEQAIAIQAAVDLSAAVNLTCRVVVGECLSLARRLRWGQPKVEALRALLAKLVIIEISGDAVLTKYAELDQLTLEAGRKMGKNDLWIAATTSAAGATLVTGDGDFDLLATAGQLRRILIPQAAHKDDLSR